MLVINLFGGPPKSIGNLIAVVLDLILIIEGSSLSSFLRQ